MGALARMLGRDAAVSDTLGVVLMVAITGAMTAGMYVWVFGLGPEEPEGPTFTLTSASGIRAGGDKLLTVETVDGDVFWNELVLKIDGRSMSYDERLAGGAKFCVATSGEACIKSDAWHESATLVQPGQTLRIHDRELVGKTLQVTHAQTGATLLTLPIGGLQDRE